MRRLPALGLLLAGLLAAAPAARAAVPASTLFVQEMSGGTLAKAGNGRYVLTVRPRGDITAFTDRPARRAWRLGTRTFLGRWARYGFATVPPNAVLSVDGAPADRDTFAITLLSARLKKDGRVAYTVEPMRGRPGALAGQVRGADTSRETRFGAASLFIDNAGTPATIVIDTPIAGRLTELDYTVTFPTGGVIGLGNPKVRLTGQRGCQSPSPNVSAFKLPPRLEVTQQLCGSGTASSLRIAVPVTLENVDPEIVVNVAIEGTAKGDVTTPPFGSCTMEIMTSSPVVPRGPTIGGCDDLVRAWATPAPS